VSDEFHDKAAVAHATTLTVSSSDGVAFIADALRHAHNDAIDLALGSIQRAREDGESDMRQVREWVKAHKVDV
jgi:hypothetical protein